MECYNEDKALDHRSTQQMLPSFTTVEGQWTSSIPRRPWNSLWAKQSQVHFASCDMEDHCLFSTVWKGRIKMGYLCDLEGSGLRQVFLWGGLIGTGPNLWYHSSGLVNSGEDFGANLRVNNWMIPAEQSVLLRRKLFTLMKRCGMVNYRDQWIFKVISNLIFWVKNFLE